MRVNHVLFCLPIVTVLACSTAADSPDDERLMWQSTAPQFMSLPNDRWGAAVPLTGLHLNTGALEGCPHESPDGRSLFIASNRDPVTVTGDIDIFVSHRDAEGNWGQPAPLTGVNSAANDYCPTPLPDGGLLFVSDRNDGRNCGTATADIYHTTPDPSGGWTEPEHLGCVVNSAGHEWSPSYVPAGGGMLFFSSNRSGKQRIYVSMRGSDGSWESPQEVVELNAASANTARPNVSADGREIVFDSDRTGSAASDIWYSHRTTPRSTWAAPVRLDDASINTSAPESRASFSRDGQRLYFGSARAGSSDIYVAQRR